MGRWISVDVDIRCSKLTKLRKRIGCSENEAIGILLGLWDWGQVNATPHGLLLNVDKDDIAVAISGTFAGSKISPFDAVDAMLDTGWLDETENGLSIHDWEVHQAPWYKAVERRKKDADRKREKREELKAEPSEETAEANNHSQKPPSNAKESKYNNDFEEFWKVYPRKVGKGEAYKKYMARRKDGFTAEELLTAATNYAKQCKKKGTNPDFIRHGKTFLNETTWFLELLPKNEADGDPVNSPSSNPFEKYLEGDK